MRFLVRLALLAIALPWHAPTLTPTQRAWCEQFARDAQLLTTSPAPAAVERMRQSAASARAAGLPGVAESLGRAADQAGGGDALTTELALQASAHGPVVVLVRLRQPSNGESPFADVALGVRDPDDAWLARFERRLPAFARSLPGYDPSWDRGEAPPRGAHAIANLVAHAGTGAQSTAPAAYLPFDPALRAAAGRSVIHWKNLTVASWFERELRPVAAVLRMGRAVSGEALSRWYALRFAAAEAGPKSVRGVAVKTALGDSWAPLAVARQDATAVLASHFLEDDPELATFLAVTFQTLNDATRGDAPPQHRPAACLVLNWCLRHGGLAATAAGWRIQDRAMLASLRSLTKELLEIESAGDARRGARLLAEYGTVTPALQATLERLPPPGAPKAEVRYEILGADARYSDGVTPK